VIIFGYAGAALLVMNLLSRPLGGLVETLRRPKLFLRIVRGLVLVGSNIMAVIAFTNLDMATAYALIFLSPFMAKLVGYVLLGEKPSRLSLLLSGLAFVGVLVIVRPGFVPLNIGSAAALGLTLFFALGYMLGRRIGEENQTALSMILFQYAFLTLGAFPFALPHLLNLTLEPAQIALFIFAGCMTVFGTICASTAFTRAPASVVAPLHYSQMLWGVVFGAMFFSEFPDKFTIMGAGIIIAAGVALIWFSRR
jgi:drug/metabolite transporter (DMT)-like permease